MLLNRYTVIYVALMTLVVVASNILVQHPLQIELGSVNLADMLTWGAFTYPFAFLVTDLTNRHFGPKTARVVVFAGFVVGICFSFVMAVPARIAFASGTAYLAGQLLDIGIFNRLRRMTWWYAPLSASLVGSALDTLIFFSLSFASVFGWIGAGDEFASGYAPLLGIFSTEAPRWISWALSDFAVKIIAGFVMLVPYGALMNVFRSQSQPVAAN